MLLAACPEDHREDKNQQLQGILPSCKALHPTQTRSGKGLSWCCNKTPRKHGRYCWKVILLFAVVIHAPCLPPPCRMKNTGAAEVLAELWPLQKLWGHLRMKNRVLNVQRKMLARWPGSSTEASQLGYSVTLRSDLGAWGYRIVHVFAQQNHPKALPSKLFQCWCFGDISPLPVRFPRDGRSKSIAVDLITFQPMFSQSDSDRLYCHNLTDYRTQRPYFS